MEGCDEDSMKALMNLQFNANKLHIEFHQKAVALRTKYEANLEMMFQAMKTQNSKVQLSNTSNNSSKTAQTVQTDSSVEEKKEEVEEEEEIVEKVASPVGSVRKGTPSQSSLPRNYKSMQRKSPSVSSNSNNNHRQSRCEEVQQQSLHDEEIQPKNLSDDDQQQNNSNAQQQNNDANDQQQNNNANNIQQQTPIDIIPQQKSPIQNIPQQKSPIQNIPQQKSPIQNIPQQKSPIQNIPQQKSPIQNIPQQKSPIQNTPQQKSPIQNTPKQRTPIENIPPQQQQQQQPNDNNYRNVKSSHVRTSGHHHCKATNNNNNESVATLPVEKKEVLERSSEVPCFWLKVFLNSKYTLDKIQVADQAPLCSMTNLKVNSDLSHLESNNAYRFILEFYFRKNEYFSNSILTKEYFVQLKGDDDKRHKRNRNNNSLCDLDLPGAAYVNCRGCQINWRPGMNVTEIEVRSAKSERAVVKRCNKNSFFNFFNPPDYWQNERLSSRQKRELEEDYRFGLHLKEKVIPRAISYYLGEKWDDSSCSGSSEETSDASTVTSTSASSRSESN